MTEITKKRGLLRVASIAAHTEVPRITEKQHIKASSRCTQVDLEDSFGKKGGLHGCQAHTFGRSLRSYCGHLYALAVRSDKLQDIIVTFTAPQLPSNTLETVP